MMFVLSTLRNGKLMYNFRATENEEMTDIAELAHGNIAVLS